jgi:hypothetical protein
MSQLLLTAFIKFGRAPNVCVFLQQPPWHYGRAQRYAQGGYSAGAVQGENVQGLSLHGAGES